MRYNRGGNEKMKTEHEQIESFSKQLSQILEGVCECSMDGIDFCIIGSLKRWYEETKK